MMTLRELWSGPCESCFFLSDEPILSDGGVLPAISKQDDSELHRICDSEQYLTWTPVNTFL